MPALIQKARVLSGTIRFFREGDSYTVPSNGIAAVDSKPGATDPAYIDLGPVDDAEIDVSGGTEHEVWRPSPGRLILSDIITVKEKFTLKFTAGEISAIAIEALFRSNNKLTALDGQFNPMAGPIRKGWLHAQLYDHEDELFLTFEFWARLKCTGGFKLGSDLVKPTFEAVLLYSALNTAGIGAP